MAKKSFEDLDVFRRALELMVTIYRVTKTFPADERFGLTQQLRRAVVSVVSNIAEGQGRLSNGEWRQFLSHARGSLYEVQAQIIAAHSLDYVDDLEASRLRGAIRRVAEPLRGLIEYVRKRAQEKMRFRNPVTTPTTRGAQTTPVQRGSQRATAANAQSAANAAVQELPASSL